MRFVVMLLLGMAIGIFGTVTVLGAMQQGTPLPRGMMAVTGHHFGSLRKQLEAGRCEAVDIRRRLQGLDALTGDLESAFLPTGGDDARFESLAADYRRAVKTALGAAPGDCTALGATVKDLGAQCKACHNEFRA